MRLNSKREPVARLTFTADELEALAHAVFVGKDTAGDNWFRMRTADIPGADQWRKSYELLGRIDCRVHAARLRLGAPS